MNKTKSETTGAKVASASAWGKNYCPEMIEVLKTVKLLGRPYGTQYLIRVMTGDVNTRWRKEEHAQIETFGCFSAQNPEWIRMLLHTMLERGFLALTDPEYCTLVVTEEGEAFLDSPREIRARPWDLKLSKYGQVLASRLRSMRNEMAFSLNTERYKVLGDFAIDQISRNWPKTIEALLALPGLSQEKVDTLGEAILVRVVEVDKLRMEHHSKDLKRRVLTPTYQQTKAMAMEGMGLLEIAHERDLKPTTVVRYLSDLGMAGEFDFRTWVERTMDARDLYRGVDYFKNVKNASFSEGLKTVGLDPNMMRLCKLYVSGFSQRVEEWALPA